MERSTIDLSVHPVQSQHQNLNKYEVLYEYFGSSRIILHDG